MESFSEHFVYFGNSSCMEGIADGSVGLIVTSPPYPMIGMWDSMFSGQNREIGENLDVSPRIAFDLMHQELDKVWRECNRVLVDGGFLCINVGDATRSFNGRFELFDNHSRVSSYCIGLGLVELPCVIWRKCVNAPNKFMGSGMLPCGAYVTLEHEYILIFRKGGKRSFPGDALKSLRRKSGYFYEERNSWFSDLWMFGGVGQDLGGCCGRERSGSFPLELAYRLICMYSVKGDIVLDPFGGLCTTMKAAMALRRNSVSYEIDGSFSDVISGMVESDGYVGELNGITSKRILKHYEFAAERERSGKELKYFNGNLGCRVMTSQEEDICFDEISGIERLSCCGGDCLGYRVDYV